MVLFVQIAPLSSFYLRFILSLYIVILLSLNSVYTVFIVFSMTKIIHFCIIINGIRLNVSETMFKLFTVSIEYPIIRTELMCFV